LDEINALLEKAHSRLEVAGELYENGHYEDSVSRAYYSMVAAASAALRLKDLTIKTHKGLQMKFQEVFIKSGEIEEDMGRMFRYSEDMRNRADYYTFEKISQEQAESIINDAELFLSRIENLINDI
jgi:uncharacterized protein (UPF0332 family)